MLACVRDLAGSASGREHSVHGERDGDGDATGREQYPAEETSEAGPFVKARRWLHGRDARVSQRHEPKR
jgi:hypothetical protein